MRVANRPLAFILAAALLACSVVIIAEVIGFAVHRGPLLVHWTTWSRLGPVNPLGRFRGPSLGHGPDGGRTEPLVLEFKPPRVTRLPLLAVCQATDATVSRRGLARILRTEATGVDGITGATVRVRRRRARVTAASGARSRAAAGALTEPVTQALGARLDGLGLRHAPRLTVRVVPRSR